MNCTPEELAKLLHRELRKQAEVSASYVEELEGVDGLTSIDGHFNLVAVAAGVLAEEKAGELEESGGQPLPSISATVEGIKHVDEQTGKLVLTKPGAGE